MNHPKFIILLLCLLLDQASVSSRVLVHNSVVVMERNHGKAKYRGVKADFKALFERRLSDGVGGTFSQKFAVEKNDGYKKLKFMKIIASILETAKARHLKVKDIKLGSHLKKVFENPGLTHTLAKYINDPKFLQKYQTEKRKYRNYLRARKQRLIEIAKRKKNQNTRRELANDKQQKFTFEPGFAGMPSPPFMMNGPHFHPPLNITINALPHPNPRTESNPVLLEHDDLEKHKEHFQKIRQALVGMGVNDEGLKTALVNLKSQIEKAAAQSFTDTTSLLT
jgi:hypothetical protein